ncbi:hypothetical protein FB451DRAFT_1159428 [Mycena latifolia]|nr:hypothetical protein FB451DRAFT_1159428 [Mycena latifolia]
MSSATARAADRAHIADIEAQILTLTRSIRVLRAEMKRTREHLDSYAYPVLTLPNEVVSEIFIHFLPVYPLCPPQTGLLSPTLLTHICRKWRGIALATPALWRAISLTDLDVWDDDRELHLLDSWLSRSGCLPLSVTMEDIFLPMPEDSLRKLVLHHTRWEHVKLALEAQSLPRQNTMPLLQQLELHVPFGCRHVPSRADYPEMPLLRSATLWDFDYPTGVVPWSQLTSLALVCQRPTHCTAVLQQTVNLVHCELITFYDPVRQPEVKLERLKSLVLMKYDEEPAKQYLDTLIAPALRTLEVPDEYFQPDPIDMLTSFILKSGCRLDNVKITGERSIPKRRYREAFPSIPELSFDSSKVCYADDSHIY